jgi:uncharacterized protein (TIGR03437 family)
MPLCRPKAPVSVSIGGQPADVVFARAVPYGWSGLLMAVVKVPAAAAGEEPAAVPAVLTAGDASSPNDTVTVWVKR